MATERPEGYPFTTVDSRIDSRGHVPVMVDWSPHGFEQFTLVGPPENDFVEAKREAVQMAKIAGCPYKVPVHG